MTSMRPTVARTRACEDLFGELFLVEGDDFLDVANAAAKIFAEADDLANDDGRARDGLHDAELAALDALGDLDFAFAGEQGNGAHLAEVHADGVVGLLEGVRARDRARRRRTLRRLRARTCRGRRRTWSPERTSMPWVLMVVSRSSRSSGVVMSPGRRSLTSP